MIWMALRKVSDRVRYIHDSLALTYVGRPVMSGSIHEAARDGNVEELNNLMAQGVDVNSRDKLSRTPLHLAAWAGQEECVKALIAAKANIGAAAKDDMNSLHFAASKGREGVCHILMSSGVSVHRKTRKGLTALHLAAQSGNTNLINLLLRRGADPDAETPKHKKAVDLAADEKVRKLLEQAMTDAATMRAQQKAGQKERSHARKRVSATDSLHPDEPGSGNEAKPTKVPKIALAHLGDEEEEQE